MCGISGIFKPSGIVDKDINLSYISIEYLKSRGPDNSQSIKVDEKIVLNHTRLSIIDPKPINNQPIYSYSGRLVLVYNGEIYNFKDLKDDLLNSNNENEYINNIKDSNSDTRILIECFDQFGVEETLKLLNGMFAFALYDRKLKNLYLGRDYYGQKPLYFYNSSDSLVFSSLLKDCLRLSGVDPKINTIAAQHGIQFGMSLLPETLFKGIFEVPPGHLIKSCIHDKNSVIKSFYDLKPEIQLQYKNKNKSNQFKKFLRSSVKRHLIADCKIGLLLSGGIDSSLIAAYMAKIINPKNINSFTLNAPNFKGQNIANEIANDLGINHNIIDIQSDEFLELIEQTFEEIDIPVYDPAIFTSRYLYRGANNLGCKVVITGDGADECFGGYSRYYKNYFFNRLLPTQISENIRNQIVRINEKFHLPRKINQILHLLLSDSPAESYLSLLSDNPSIHQYSFCIKSLVQDLFKMSPGPDLYCIIDKMFFLPNKMLLKADRAAMLESVESRSPFLDMNFLACRNLVDNIEPKKLLKKELIKKVANYPLNLKKEGLYSPYNLLFNSPSIRSLLASKIFEDMDQILGLSNFSTNVRKETLNFKKSGKVPNSLWNYLALAKWMQINIF